MRSSIIILLFSSFLVCSQEAVQKQDAKKINVEIRITRTSAYCGGARPSQEVMTELQTPKPYSGKKLYLKKGEKNTFTTKIFMEITSDSAGKVNCQLQPGKYLIVDEFKKDTSYYNRLKKRYSTLTPNYSAIDKLCLKNWYEQPDLVFELKEGEVKDLTINFHKNCTWNEIPCIEFKGPVPQ
jgi:hypothetical protein